MTGDMMGLDAVTIESDDRAVGLRNVPNTWDVFATHFPHKPVVPGVVIMGCLERLGQQLLVQRTGRDGWRLAGVQRARFRHFVQPGDRMQLTLEVKDGQDDHVVMKATVDVDGRTVTTVTGFAMSRGAHA